VAHDGRNAAVGPAADVAVPAGADVVDGTGRFLSPGFADMHVHLYTEGDLFTYIANGITTVRDMAGDTSHLALRARVASGRLVGPRIITAGPVVEAAPLSHPDNVLLESPGAVRAELVRQRTAGYDFVKVYNRLARPVYDSVVAVARELGLPVTGHVPLEVGLDGALAARQTSIEHFRGYVQVLLSRSAALSSDTSFRDWSVAWNRIDDTRLASLVARTVAAGVWNVPTFAFTVHELSPPKRMRVCSRARRFATTASRGCRPTARRRATCASSPSRTIWRRSPGSKGSSDLPGHWMQQARDCSWAPTRGSPDTRTPTSSSCSYVRGSRRHACCAWPRSTRRAISARAPTGAWSLRGGARTSCSSTETRFWTSGTRGGCGR